MISGGRILVAEDDAIVRRTTRSALEAAGYETLGAEDGEEALRLARAQRPDLILLDVNMPKMDGFEALQRLKADPELAMIFVIIVSGSRLDTDSQVQGLQTGADGYLLRPLSNRELVARVQSLLRIKAAEDAVRAKEKQLHDLIASNLDGMLVVAQEGHVLFANPAACDLLNRPPDTMSGQFVGVPLAAGDHTELDLLRPDGRRRVVEMRVTPIVWEDQPAFLAALRDITHRKEAEESTRQLNAELEQRVAERTRDLRLAQEQLVRREKLAVLGQLAGSVGHELRNPLGVISNAVYLLKLLQRQADARIVSYLDMIDAETRSAERIITDLLNFARVKNVNPEAVAIPALVSGVLARYAVPAGVHVTVDVPADLQAAWADPLHLEHVLGNLVQNACDAMPGDGNLVISARLAAGGCLEAGEQEPAHLASGGPPPCPEQHIAITVQDTGAGISPGNMTQLFEPLFTTKPKGIGLGLPVSKELVQANGGKIEVESKPGIGSMFRVHLPIHSGPVEQSP